MSVLTEIKQAVITGDADRTKECVERALAEGASVLAIINDGLVSGMSVIGVRFKNNEVYVPEVLISARAMHAGMAVIKPLIADANIKEKATVVIGTVKGDMHDIGKNLVSMMLEGAGYKVIDLGVNVSAEKFIEAINDHKPQVVGLSALLTTTMIQMKLTIEELKRYSGLVKVIVGGAPVTQKFADEVGAHAFAPDAGSAVAKVEELLDFC